MQLVSVRQEIVAEINSQPKWERLQEEAYSRLPYHPQFLPADRIEPCYMPNHLGAGRYDFLVEHKHGLYNATLYLLAYALNPDALFYVYLQWCACG